MAPSSRMTPSSPVSVKEVAVSERCKTCGSLEGDPEGHERCPNCGKHKRGWRRQSCLQLCSECERHGVGE